MRVRTAAVEEQQLSNPRKLQTCESIDSTWRDGMTPCGPETGLA